MLDIDKKYLLAVNRQLTNYTSEQIHPYRDFYVGPIYTLIARPPDFIQRKIISVSEKLAEQLTEHYYYEPNQLHVTLQLIGTDISPKVIEIIQNVLKGKILRVAAHGVGINAHGIAISVYDLSAYEVSDIRLKLRKKLALSINYKEHDPIWDELLWVNFMRFNEQPDKEGLSLIKALSNQEIGRFEIKEWQLYKTTSRVLDPIEKRVNTYFLRLTARQMIV